MHPALIPLLAAALAVDPPSATADPGAADAGASAGASADAAPADLALQLPPAIRAVRTAKPPKLDGVLDDPEWAAAPSQDDFTQNTPNPGHPATQHTTFKILYDDRALYIGMRCDDTDPAGIVAKLTRRDRFVETDMAGVEIDSLGDKKLAYGFLVNAAGTQIDYIRTGDNNQDTTWDGVWDSAISRDDRGWGLEMAIPFSALRFKATREMSFRLQAARYISRLQELDQWVYQPPSQQGVLLRMGKVDGLESISQSRGLELRPFVLAALDHRYGFPGFDPPSGTSPNLSAGGELTYQPTPDLTVDAAVFPDFGQVDADQVVLNLTTFEIFFPEKRPFFLARNDLFLLQDDQGNPILTQLFYSRRIGTVPPLPSIGANESVLSQPLTDTIFGAAKLTGRISDRVSIGLLDAVTSPEFAEIGQPDGSHAPRAVDVLTQFAVGRVRANLPGGFTLGVSGTAVNRHDVGQLVGPEGCPNTDLPQGADNRCLPDAYTGGLDLNWSSPDGKYTAAATLLGSQLLHGPFIQQADGFLVGPGSRGYGGLLYLSKAGGEHLVGGLTYEGYSPTLDLNDAGFLLRQNYNNFGGRADWRTTEPAGPTLKTDNTLSGFAHFDFAGNPLNQGVDISNNTLWKNFWDTGVDFQLYPSYYDNRETRDGTFYERPGQPGVSIWCFTDSRNLLRIGGSNTLFTDARGLNENLDFTVTLNAFNHLEISLEPSLQWSSGDPRWIDTFGDAFNHTYLFGDLDARATSATLRGSWTFTPKLSLQVYTQAFVATEHFTNFFTASTNAITRRIKQSDLSPSGSLGVDADEKYGNVNVNVVLRWEYLPGSTLYLVYTRAQSQGNPTPSLNPDRPDILSLQKGPYDDVVLLKASYYFGT